MGINLLVAVLTGVGSDVQGRIGGCHIAFALAWCRLRLFSGLIYILFAA
jgi:hypothetical protein